MTLRYDRRVPDELLDALDRSGFAHSLVQNARGGRGGLDLQLRGYAGKTPWASLYVGLSKVIDLEYAAKRGFKLDAHPSYKQPANGWNPMWERWQPIECVFRSKSITRFGRCRSLVSDEADHPFRSMSISDFG